MDDRSTPLLRLLGDIKETLDKFVETVSAHQKSEARQTKEQSETESKVVVRLPSEIAEYYKSEERDRSKNARRDSRRLGLEIAAVVAAIVLAVLTFSTLRTLNGQLTEARRANGDLEMQFQAQQRAWVGYEEIKIMQPTFFVYPDNPIQARTQVNLDVTVPLKNVGTSPALNVETSMNATMTEQIGAFPTVEPMMESVCGGADKNAKAIGQVLFPSSPATNVEWPMAIQTPFLQINQVHRVWVNICVTYNSTTDQKIHHTKIWMASWPISGNPTEIRRTANPNIIYYSVPVTQWTVVKTEAD